MTEEEREAQSAVGREEIGPLDQDELEAFIQRIQRNGDPTTAELAHSIVGFVQSFYRNEAFLDALRPSASTSTLIDREQAAREIERTELVGGGVADMRAVAAAVVRNAALVPGVDPSASAGGDELREAAQPFADIAEWWGTEFCKRNPNHPIYGSVDYAGVKPTLCVTISQAERLRTALTPSAPRGDGGELGPLWRSVHAVHSRAMSEGHSVDQYRRDMLEALLTPPTAAPAGDFLTHLREVNSERLAAWEQPGPIMLCEHCGSSNPETVNCAPPFDVHAHSFTKPHPYLTRDSAKTDSLFHAVELGGEAGEVLNIVKKLHREEMGWRGSRATVEQLADEIGDVLICLDKLAGHYGIDLAEATARKFNATSDKVGLPHKLAATGGDDAGLRAALFAVRYDIEENPLNDKSIVCTVWHSEAETTVDFINAALSAPAPKSGEE